MSYEMEKRALNELSEYQKRSMLSIQYKLLKNWVLERLASSFPIPSWRASLHRKRGVNIGRDVYIGYDIVFDRIFPERIFIGDHSSVGDKSLISTHANLPMNTPLRKIYPRKVDFVRIGKGVWMMPHVVVIPGVTIGDYSVIATGSVVIHDIPPMTLAVGVPAKPIKDLSDKLKEYIHEKEYKVLIEKRKEILKSKP